MEAGKLRHLVKVQEPMPTANEFGEPEIAWVDFATVWAAIEPLRGRERWAAQQINAEVSHRIRMRFLAGVLATFRVLFGVRAFDIQAVLNIEERNRELQLLCIERPDGA